MAGARRAWARPALGDSCLSPPVAVLVSADALWERGFGVVFPELDGVDAFDEVSATLDLIAALAARCWSFRVMVEPFSLTWLQALVAAARQRLDGFLKKPPASHSVRGQGHCSSSSCWRPKP
jgi:hypothetical protein